MNKKKPKSPETEEQRKQRIELSKAVRQQVMPDKTKYKRKPKHVRFDDD